MQAIEQSGWELRSCYVCECDLDAQEGSGVHSVLEPLLLHCLDGYGCPSKDQVAFMPCCNQVFLFCQSNFVQGLQRHSSQVSEGIVYAREAGEEPLMHRLQVVCVYTQFACVGHDRSAFMAGKLPSRCMPLGRSGPSCICDSPVTLVSRLWRSFQRSKSLSFCLS